MYLPWIVSLNGGNVLKLDTGMREIKELLESYLCQNAVDIYVINEDFAGAINVIFYFGELIFKINVTTGI